MPADCMEPLLLPAARQTAPTGQLGLNWSSGLDASLVNWQQHFRVSGSASLRFSTFSAKPCGVCIDTVLL